MSTHIPDPDGRDLPDDVTEADAADQRLSVGAEDEPDRELPDEAVGLVDEANPADVWEQSQTVSFDEDEREGD